MKRVNNLLVLVSLVFLASCNYSVDSTKAYSENMGNEFGGGTSVVCRGKNGQVESIELLDYYEGKHMQPGYQLDLGSFSQELDAARFVIKRLSVLDPSLAKRYSDWVDVFYASTQFVSDALLPDSRDYGPIPLAANCKVEQVAMQSPSLTEGGKFFTIQKELWNAMTVQQRAGLVLHEIIYADARRLGHKNSTPSRHFNMQLSSTKFSSMKTVEYLGLLEKLGLTNAKDFKQAPIWVMNPIRLPSVTIERKYQASLLNFAKDPKNLKLSFFLVAGPNWLKVTEEGMIEGLANAKHIGEHQLTVQATNSSMESSVVTVNISVGRGPVWSQNPIDLSFQVTGKPFTYDLKKNALLFSAKEVVFSATQLPSWLSLSKEGVLTGSPRTKHVGKYFLNGIQLTTEFGVSQAVASGEVIGGAPFIKWNTVRDLEMAVNTPYLHDLAPYVDSTEDVLFEKLSGPSSFKVSKDGILSGAFDKSLKGIEFLKVKASFEIEGTTYSDTTTIGVLLDFSTECPKWKDREKIFKVVKGQPFSIPINFKDLYEPYYAALDVGNTQRYAYFIKDFDAYELIKTITEVKYETGPNLGDTNNVGAGFITGILTNEGEKFINTSSGIIKHGRNPGIEAMVCETGSIMTIKIKVEPPLINEALALGDNHSCSLIGEKITCWGSNQKHQLEVPKVSHPKLIAAQGDRSCVFDDLGLTCWGDTPFHLRNPTLKKVDSVSVGHKHVCVLGDGTVKCWGKKSVENVPVLSNPREVVSGSDFACAADDSGIECWGSYQAKIQKNPTHERYFQLSAYEDKFCYFRDSTERSHHWRRANCINTATKQELINKSEHLSYFFTAGTEKFCSLYTPDQVSLSVGCKNYSDFNHYENVELDSPRLLASGRAHSCAIHKAGIKCWGDNTHGQATAP